MFGGGLSVFTSLSFFLVTCGRFDVIRPGAPGRCNTGQLSFSFLPASGRTWKGVGGVIVCSESCCVPYKELVIYLFTFGSQLAVFDASSLVSLCSEVPL